MNNLATLIKRYCQSISSLFSQPNYTYSSNVIAFCIPLLSIWPANPQSTTPLVPRLLQYPQTTRLHALCADSKPRPHALKTSLPPAARSKIKPMALYLPLAVLPCPNPTACPN